MTEDLGMFGPSGASHWTPIPAPPKEGREAGEREIECQHCHGTRETYKAVNEEDVLPCRHCGDREAGTPTAEEVIAACRVALEKAAPYVNSYESLHWSAWGAYSMSARAKLDLTKAEDAVRDGERLAAAWEAARR